MTYESWENVIIRSSKHCLKSWKKTSKRLESKKNLLAISKSSIQTSLIICAKQTLIAILEIIRNRQNHDQNHENHYHENDDRRQDSFNQLRIFWTKKNYQSDIDFHLSQSDNDLSNQSDNDFSNQSDNDSHLFTLRTVKSHSLLNFKTFNQLTDEFSLKNFS
jgi:hypothetical protein